MQAQFTTIIQQYFCRKSALSNNVCGYSCMENKGIYFVVDTSCKIALIHQAAILHFEMIHQACISKTVFIFFSDKLDMIFIQSCWNYVKMARQFSVMHGFIYNAVLKL